MCLSFMGFIPNDLDPKNDERVLYSHPDYPALEALYIAANGDNWSNTVNNLDPWDVSPTSNCYPCDWHGVTCDNVGRVIGLDLENNNLNGNIPPLIGTLNRLQWLHLNNNQLFGGIPIEIGNLLQLEYLYLSENQLTGGIPNEIGNLSNLLVLHLQQNNNLKGQIPTTIGNLFNLKELLLYEDSLSGNIPTQIGNLVNLEILDCWNNQLTGSIPFQIGNLGNLDFLSFGLNSLSGAIPSSFGNLSKLRDVRLNGNELTSIPPQIGNLSSLKFAYLSSNQFSGDLPSQFANLDSLKVLRLHYNQLTGTLPPQYKELTVLQELSLHDNNLTGCIPSGYDVFCGKNVYLFNNSSPDLVNNFNDFCDFDAGECPPCNSTHPDAAALISFYEATGGNGWVNNTNWDPTGEISCDPCADNWFGISCEFFGGVQRVTSIHMFSNNLVGTLPPEIGDLKELKNIGLQGFNQFLSGSIPKEIGRLSNLNYLNLSANQLTGTITDSLANLSNLISLRLEENQLSGPIPFPLGFLSNLENMNLGNNNLTGAIPTELGYLTNLKTLRLFGNNISGMLPPELGNLNNLTAFSVSYNPLLTGCLPEEYITFCNNSTMVSFNNTDLDEQNFSNFCMNQSGVCTTCNPCDTINLPNNPFFGDTIFIACDSIISEMDILNTPMDSSDVTYQSGISIILKPGFHVQAGADFLAQITPCNSPIVGQPTFSRELLNQNNTISPITQIDIFPNPFSSGTTIQFAISEAMPIQLQLIDITGKVVQTIVPQSHYEMGQYQINFQNEQLQTGIYFFQLSSSKERLVKKVMVTR